jgi:hypothetical protein
LPEDHLPQAVADPLSAKDKKKVLVGYLVFIQCFGENSVNG